MQDRLKSALEAGEATNTLSTPANVRLWSHPKGIMKVQSKSVVAMGKGIDAEIVSLNYLNNFDASRVDLIKTVFGIAFEAG